MTEWFWALEVSWAVTVRQMGETGSARMLPIAAHRTRATLKTTTNYPPHTDPTFLVTLPASHQRTTTTSTLLFLIAGL